MVGRGTCRSTLVPNDDDRPAESLLGVEELGLNDELTAPDVHVIVDACMRIGTEIHIQVPVHAGKAITSKPTGQHACFASLVDQGHAVRDWKESEEYPCSSLFETCRALKAAVCFLNSVKSHPCLYWEGCLEVQNRENSDECTTEFD